MKIISAFIILAVTLALPVVAGAAADSNQGALLLSYLRLEIAQQAGPLSAAMAKETSRENQEEIARAVTQWTDTRIAAIRAGLESRFPGQSRDFFRLYVERYTTCEEKEDAAFLKQTAGELGLAVAPKDYAALRADLLRTALKPDVMATSQLLGEVQTWLDVKHRQPGKTPPLQAWLSRREDAPVRSAAPRPVKTDPLAAAEASAGNYTDSAVPADANPLEAISAQEKNRREKKRQDAIVEMQQVSAERKQYEDQAAAEKTARAQAESEAMKHQAEQMAAVEQTALQQRQNSWSAHLMNAAVSLVGSVGGAAGGAVGAAAGLQAANRMFP